MASMKPRSVTGAVPATQQPIYKVPQGFWAIVVGATFCNDGGADAVLSVYVNGRGDGARRVVRAFIDGGTPTTVAEQTRFSLEHERWILNEGDAIEATPSASSFTYHLSILERPL